MTPLEVSRRRFLAGAVAGGAAATVPVDLVARAAEALAGSGARFLTGAEYAACDALCARILPADAGHPGAREARAVDFIDLFLAAFDLPAATADAPAVWVRGRFSGRNPYPSPSGGTASAAYPASDMRDPAGQRHFLPLSGPRALAWRARLYGGSVITDNPDLPGAYRDAVRTGLIPLDPPLRDLYRAGLRAFDELARSTAGARFADVAVGVQDALLARAAGSFTLGGATAAAPAPREVTRLYPVLVEHTLQGCFALPEYGGNRDGVMWGLARWEGDTQPLGNSIYDPMLSDAALGDAQGHSAGFGAPGVYAPQGGYRELRAVSGRDPAADPTEGAAIIALLGGG